MLASRPAAAAAAMAVRRSASVVGLAGLTALGSRVAIELPGTPVPLTLQVAAVLLSGLLLGARGGALSQLLFLAGIASGLPLDARMAGPAAFIGPTAGYLFGFVASAAAAGLLLRTLGRTWPGLAVACLGGLAALYLCGTTWLALWLGVDAVQAVRAGVLPFLVADLAKGALAVGIAAGLSGRRDRHHA
ncbi:MAG: biotin transporter BioY [Anaerolineae bacterium]|nr:biotin transporter BioY [Anaerolineae bacterium]